MTWLLLNIKGRCEVFFNFLLKITSCACLVMSGLKLIFHCNTQSWTLARLSFNSFAEASTLKTTENSEVSCTKSFALDDESFVESLIYIKNRSGPKIDSWGTPALTSAHEQNWPFKTTFCFLFFRKSFIKFKSLPEITFYFNLKIIHSRQTLSKTL